MKRVRLFNGVLAGAFLAMTVMLAMRGINGPFNPAAHAAATGTPVFNADNFNSAASTGNCIMLGLSGALTLVFGWRAIRGKTPGKPGG